MTSEIMQNYYRRIVNDSANEISDNRNMINNNKTTSKSFEYKTKMIGSMPNNNNMLDATVVFPVKYLSNYWRSIDFPLINFEIEVDYIWKKNCVI